MNQANALLHLQSVDQQLIKTNKRLREITTQFENDAVIASAQAQVTEAQGAVSPLATQVRNLELEIQGSVEKIKIADETLYSGRVKNPKEMQELQQEIDALGRRKSELEENLLNVMLGLESAQAAVNAAQADLQTTVESRAGEKRSLLDEQTRLTEQANALRSQREAALARVEEAVFQIYRGLMSKKGGIAVAKLDGQSCSVCQIEQTMAIVLEAKRGQGLVYCVNCGRILVG